MQLNSAVANKDHKKRFNTKKKLNLEERAFAKIDVKKELKTLLVMLDQLKVDYEQYFLGITIYRPDKLEKDLKRQIRLIRRAPFKRPWQAYKLRAIEARYHTFNDYWQRTIKEKESGIYSKDVFKANLKEHFKKEDLKLQTQAGKVSKQVVALYDTYKMALEKQIGKKVNLDLSTFQSNLKKQAAAIKAQHADKKISFRVVVSDGRVNLKAKLI
jgi:hypothetical protein